MSLFSRLTSAVKRLFTRSKSYGERVMSQLMHGIGGYTSFFGGWGSDRGEAVKHMRGWPYLAIRAIGEEVALMPPHVGRIKAEEEKPKGPQGKRWLTDLQKRKALVHLQPHEDLELVDSDDPLLRLLRNPNSWDVGWTFWYKLIMYLELTGSTYIWVVPNKAGKPAEMWVIPAHWVRPYPGESEEGKIIDFYEIRPWGAMSGGPGCFNIPAEDMIWIYYPNPFWVMDGLSPMTAVSEWIDCAESIDASRWFSFKNGPRPGMIVTADKEIADPSKEQIDRFKAEFAADYQGESKSKLPMTLPPGHDVKPWTTNPEEMDYGNSFDQHRDSILAAFKTGKSILGITEEVNYASAVAARANFILSTIKPKLTLIGQILTERLAHQFDEDLCVYWPDVTPDDPQQKLAENVAYLDKRVKLVNEVRAELGLEPVPWGDKPWGQIGEGPVDAMALNDMDFGAEEDPTKPEPVVPQMGTEKPETGQPRAPKGGGKNRIFGRKATCSRCGTVLKSNGDLVWCPACRKEPSKNGHAASV